ncbi:hypothetical protein [Candidatus Bodocaedibacter vickermanii]|uniref:Antitoxin with colicin/pyocin immunity domain n=1 Tax=Candidatus Bodocaedibacter vickermanii TaxID=2741701 RepID=A0A7L9RTD8_9PROT|nr:Putative antitoxin with colicin/pyocin immunity domain [Candidatus Paracaedibacteraceae bacterium 'Lake Konstanz']
MNKIINDNEAISLIESLYNGVQTSEKERSLIWDRLENYQTGIAEVIFALEKRIDSKEILRLAREKNKPIIL